MPSPAEVARFQRLIATLAVRATTSAITTYQALGAGQDFKEAFPAAVDPFLSAAGTLTAQWYDDLDPQAAFATEIPPPIAEEALIASAGWALGQSDVITALGGVAERNVFKTSRDTVMLNARREDVRFARYASANACPWCQVLATRGAVYRSEDNAVAGHDNCHCIAVPVRGNDEWTPPDYVQQWEQNYIDARGEVGGNLDDIVNYMRRNQ